MRPFVSVIIPNYNHSLYLNQRIDSVLAQSYTHFEVILLDDCSTDNSVTLIEAYRTHPKVTHILLNDRNSGSTFRQWKKGLDVAVGELIWIAESDDFCTPLFLETAIGTFEADATLHLFFSASARVNSAGMVEGSFDPLLANIKGLDFTNDFVMDDELFIAKGLNLTNVVMNASAAVFKKSAVKNFFETVYLQFKYCGDWYFWAELIQGGRVAFSATKLNSFRCHNKSTRAAKPFALQIQAYKEELQVLHLIGKLYQYKPAAERINRTLDNIIWLTPAKKLPFVFIYFAKEMPTVAIPLAMRYGYRMFKKISK